jgi:hypothetical protein
MKAEDKELYKSELEFANSLMTFEDYFEDWQLDIVLSLMQRNANQRVIEELEVILNQYEATPCGGVVDAQALVERIDKLKQE